VNRFLGDQHVTRHTRKRHMSAIRKLAKMLWVLSGTDEASRMYTALTMTGVPKTTSAMPSARAMPLTPADVYQVLAVWQDPDCSASATGR
jgi:hypothetical protein